MFYPLHRTIIETNVGLDKTRCYQAFRIQGKIVILGGNFNNSCLFIFYRMIAPMMAEFQFIGLATQSQS